jgi:putative endonuclease
MWKKKINGSAFTSFYHHPHCCSVDFVLQSERHSIGGSPACAGRSNGRIEIMWWVYVLRSEKKKWYYVGSTNRLEIRVEEHNRGKVVSTKSYRPLRLVYSQQFDTEIDARQYERKLKDKRIEKEELIRKIENWGIV